MNSSEQTAFVPGQRIKDNIIVAFECVHTLKRRSRGRKGLMALKLDMSKAYDLVKWLFLVESLLRECEGRQVERDKMQSRSSDLTHLIFADDSLLFATVGETSCAEINDLLTHFERASGHVINLQKLFSPNSTPRMRKLVLSRLGMSRDYAYSNYLGLPACVGRSKARIFDEVKERGMEKTTRVERKAFFNWGP
ncbi:uncharacterized protein LOC142544467 [Primulina tabacum]|uniref:uncharacterized protein LOC142544467 n=1 Tax=Primulina tabacum TaxID=48773 RepID=UPI003F593806